MAFALGSFVTGLFSGAKSAQELVKTYDDLQTSRQLREGGKDIANALSGDYGSGGGTGDYGSGGVTGYPSSGVAPDGSGSGGAPSDGGGYLGGGDQIMTPGGAVRGGGYGSLNDLQQSIISKSEGTWGPNGIDYNVMAGEKPGQTKNDLVNTTISNIAKLPGPDFGGFQINRSNLFWTSKALGLDPNTTKFTPGVQAQMADLIHQKQGPQAWNGLNNNQSYMRQFRAAYLPAASQGTVPTPSTATAPTLAAGGALGGGGPYTPMGTSTPGVQGSGQAIPNPTPNLGPGDPGYRVPRGRQVSRPTPYAQSVLAGAASPSPAERHSFEVYQGAGGQLPIETWLPQTRAGSPPAPNGPLVGGGAPQQTALPGPSQVEDPDAAVDDGTTTED
jgi:hypothetical protein